MKLDLHTHSTASDGQYTPTQLVTMAKNQELEYFAITDHDTIDGIAEARLAATKLGVNFIPGIEISTFQGEQVHMLGLGIDETNPEIIAACQSYKARRLGRGDRIITFLNEKGIPVQKSDLPVDKEGSLGRPHFAAYLIEHGYVHSTQEAFQRYLDTKEFHDKTDLPRPTPAQAIQVIHAAGGKAILAHPGLLKMGRVWQSDFIHSLCQEGLDGVEVYYLKHTKKQITFYHTLMKEHNLCWSGGSDFHGEKVKPDVPFGIQINCEEKLCDALNQPYFLA